MYDELFRRVPDHPQLTRDPTSRGRSRQVEIKLLMIRRFLPQRGVFLEVGAGDCALAARVAAIASTVYALDVSEEITSRTDLPDAVRLVLTDGREIPIPSASVDLAFSNQLLEHLHPDDAASQTRSICRSLRPGGAYVCITPDRLTGPHDVSLAFDEVATGLHLHEYTSRELVSLMRRSGFRKTRQLVKVRSFVLVLPTWPIRSVEWLLEALPRGWGRTVARRTPFRKLLGSVVSFKPRPVG